MEVFVNEKPLQVNDGITVAALMEQMGVKPQGVAVAIDNVVISKDKWQEYTLTDKTAMILIHAVSGG